MSIQKIIDEERKKSKLFEIDPKKINRLLNLLERNSDPYFQEQSAKTRKELGTHAKENSYWYGTQGPMGGKKHTEEARLKSARHGKDNGMTGNGHLVAGDNNGFYGKEHTEESRQRIAEIAAQREATKLCEHCNQYFTPQSYKQHHGDRCKENPNRVIIQRKKYKRKEHILVTCTHCGKVGSGPNMTRYHFNNCKEKS